VDAHLKGQGGIRDYLVKRWETWTPTSPQSILWVIAIFEAFLRPQSATLKEIVQDGFTIRVWTGVDKEAMQADYWAATKSP
jgi:hypothetical protein